MKYIVFILIQINLINSYKRDKRSLAHIYNDNLDEETLELLGHPKIGALRRVIVED